MIHLYRITIVSITSDKLSIKGGLTLTVQQDLEKAVASAQAALGTYSMFATSTQDQSAKQMFKELSSDMQRHVDMLNGRLTYVTQGNDLNQKQQ